MNYVGVAGAMKPSKIDVVIVLLLIVICVIFYRALISRDYFSYDEADYMFAVSKGFFANYLDQNSISLFTFLDKGVKQGLQTERQTSLSEFIRSSEDITFYRHYHGPLYFYGLIISQYFVGRDEYSTRWASFLFLMATVITLYGIGLFLVRGNARVAAVLSSLLLMHSTSNITTAAQVTPHGLYVLTAIVALFLTAKLFQTNDLRYWYSALIATAFSFMVIEYASLLLVTLVVSVFVQRRDIFPHWSTRRYAKFIAVSVLLFVGVTFILWPGAWLKLTLIKNYIFFAYFALVRGGQYGTQTFWQVWWHRLCNSPIEYVLIVSATIAAIIGLRHHRWYLPFLIYALLVLITTFRNTSPSPTYISSLLPPLYVLTGTIVAKSLLRSLIPVRIAAVVVIVLAILADAYFRFVPLESRRVTYTPMKDVVEYFRSNHLEDKRVLVDRKLLPTLHYYFPHEDFSSYSEKSSGLASIIERLQASPYDGVLHAGSNHSVFGEQLRQYFVIHPETVTVIPSSNLQVVYYEIGLGQ